MAKSDMPLAEMKKPSAARGIVTGEAWHSSNVRMSWIRNMASCVFHRLLAMLVQDGTLGSTKSPAARKSTSHNL